MRVNKEEMPLSEVRFVSKTHQHEKFEEWAKEMLAQPSMSKKLLELRIMRSITQSRRIAVEKNSKDLVFLLSSWSIETHSFVTSCEEFSLTLEDVMMLTSLPAFDDIQVTHFKLSDKENKERHDALTSFLQKIKYGTAKKSTYLT